MVVDNPMADRYTHLSSYIRIYIKFVVIPFAEQTKGIPIFLYRFFYPTLHYLISVISLV